MNEMISSYDNFIASRDHDRTITPATQSTWDYRNLEKQLEEHKTKTIMVVDDDPDTTLTFKRSLEIENYNNTQNNITFEVYTYNHPELALSEFKPNFYNLLLIDINMPKINGFDLYDKMKAIDNKVKVCFIVAYEVNYLALRQIFPEPKLECFIQRSIEIGKLVGRIKAELEQ
jgi:CheY-like chemotaxis protein